MDHFTGSVNCCILQDHHHQEAKYRPAFRRDWSVTELEGYFAFW